jgi:hypothetical protein
VVKVLDDDRWIVNLGTAQGVDFDDRFVIFEPGESITDPETGEDLGTLELVRTRASAAHVQERLTILARDAPTAASAPTVLSAQMAALPGGRRGGSDAPPRIRVGDRVRRIGRAGG